MAKLKAARERKKAEKGRTTKRQTWADWEVEDLSDGLALAIVWLWPCFASHRNHH
jgi:hypothetical protein